MGALRHARVLGYALAAAFCLVTAIASAEAGPSEGFIDSWIRERVVGGLERALGAKVRMARLDTSPLSLSARIEGFEMELPAPNAPPLRFRAAVVRVRWAWEDLLAAPGGRIHVSELELVRPELEFDDRFVTAWAERPRHGGPLEIRVDQLSTEGGRLRYEDLDQPMEFQAGAFEVRSDWNLHRRALVGRFSMEASFLQAPFARPLPLKLEGGFALAQRRLDLAAVRAEGPGLSIELQGHAIWGGGFAFRGEALAEASVEALTPWLAPDFPKIAGRVAGRFDVERAGGPLVVRGRCTATGARFGLLSVSRGEADVVKRPGRLDLDQIVAQAYGGKVEGSVAVELDGSPRFRASVTGSGLDLERLLSLVGKPLPLASRARLDLDLEGEARKRATWEGSGTIACEAKTGDAVHLPLSGSGRLLFQDGRFRLERTRIDVAAASLALGTDLDLRADPPRGELTFDGTTSDAARTQAGLLRILEALDAGQADVLRRPLTGSGGFQARVGVGGALDAEVRLTLADGSWDGEVFDRADLDLGVREGELEIRSLHTVRGTADVTGRGLFALGETPRLLALEGRVDRLDLGLLLRRLGLKLDASGTLSGHVEVHREDGELGGGGRIVLSGGELLGERIDRGESELRVGGGAVMFEGLRLEGPALEVEGRAVVGLDTGAAEIALTRARVTLASLELLRAPPMRASGEAELEGTLRVGRDGPSGSLAVKTRGMAISAGGFSLEPSQSELVQGALTLDPEGLSVDLGNEEEGPWAFTGRVLWGKELHCEGDLDLRRAEATFAPGGVPPLRSRVTGRFHLVGPLGKPQEIAVSGDIREASFSSGPYTLVSAAALPLALREGVVRIGPGVLEGSGARLEGYVGFGLAGGELEVEARGQADLGLLLASWPDIRGSGPVTVEIRGRGTVDRPDVSGTLHLEGGRLRRLGFPDVLEQVDLLARIDRDRVEIERLEGLLGGGEITGTGWAVLSGFGLASYRAEVEARDVVVSWPEGFKGVYRGTLILEGTPAAAAMRGRLEMIQGHYGRELTWGQLLATHREAYLPPERSSLPRNVLLDIDLVADGNVWIRNETARIEARLDLHLGGALDRPGLTGRIWLFEGGTVRFRDVEYRVIAGTVDFTELGRVNPYLDLRAQTRVQSYDVFLHVEGTAERFRYELTSDPPLSQPDIIALLLTGSPLEAPATGAPRPGAFTGDLAANYFAGALSERFTRQLRRALGLERLEVNSLLVEGSADPTTRITVGKRVNEHVRLIYSTDVGATGRQLYRVDWQALRNLRLSFTRETTGGVGGELEFERRFGAGPGTPGQAARYERTHDGEGAEEARTAPLVESVGIAGVSEPEAHDLERGLPQVAGRPLRRADVFEGARVIRAALVRKGRLEARVKAEVVASEGGAGRVRVVYQVEPGPMVRVELLGVEGKERRQLLRTLDALWLEGPFGSSTYEDAAAALLEKLRGRGYYAALVQLEVRDEGGERAVRFLVERGSPVRVREVRLEGASAFQEGELLQLLTTRPDEALSHRLLNPKELSQDVEVLRRFYQDEGYLDVRVEEEVALSVDGEEAVVRFRVLEGRRYTLARLEAPEGLEIPAATLVEASGLHEGDVFSPSRLAEAESRIRAKLDTEGYPDARVESEVSFAEAAATVVLKVEPGSRKRVGRVDIVGLRVTRPKVVRRELAFEVGELLSTSALLETQHRLYRLGLFRGVRLSYDPMPGSDPSLYVVRVQLEEAPPVRLSVGAGYDSEGGARGSLSISHQNVGGYGRELALQGKASEIERRVQLVAREPRLFNRSLEALLSAFWERREQVGFTVTRRATALRVERKLRPGWTRYVRYNFQRVDLSDVVNPGALLQEKLENLRLGDMSVALVRDTRDDLFLPTRGGYAAVEGRVFAPVLLSDASFVKVLTQGSMTHSFGQHRGLSFASALRIGLAETYGGTVTVPLSERFFAGGESTVRGFQRDGVGPRDVDLTTGESRPAGGEALLLFNEELRFPIFWRVKGVLFYDAGNVYRTLDDADPTDLRHAAGLGFRLETPIGPLRLEYGHKLDREPGESRGELFFAIGSTF